MSEATIINLIYVFAVLCGLALAWFVLRGNDEQPPPPAKETDDMPDEYWRDM